MAAESSEATLQAALPSYHAATTELSLTNTISDAAYAYAGFTISDLRAQILANAAMIKPIFNNEKTRDEYGLELTLIRGSSGQHAIKRQLITNIEG
jgi:lipase chaperone LimK